MFNDFFKHVGEVITGLLSQWEIWAFILVSGILISVPIFSFSEILGFAFAFVRATWWFWAFFILFVPFRALLLYWRQTEYKKAETAEGKYILLEIRIPRELMKGPKGMEQIFLSMHSLGNGPGTLHEEYLDGEVPLWFGFEMVSLGGQVHLYVRIPKRHRNLVETAFFSHYADAEITEVPDYMKVLPATTAELYAQEKDMWGTEIALAKEDAYPIKTYSMFEGGEERQVDPMSTFLEVLGKLKAEETACVQFVICPAPKDWAKKWGDTLKKLREPEMFGAGEEKVQMERTPGQSELISAMESKLSKAAYNTLIRIMYFAPKAVFKEGSGFVRGGIMGALNQCSAPNLNAFKGNSPMATKIDPWKAPYKIGIDTRTEYRKQRILRMFRGRMWPPETYTARLFSSYFFNSNFNTDAFEMSTEELATVFHLPTAMVLTAPHIRRVESKKTGPPSGIAIFGDESHLERFEQKEQ